jgi:hypothetical protein
MEEKMEKLGQDKVYSMVFTKQTMMTVQKKKKTAEVRKSGLQSLLL